MSIHLAIPSTNKVLVIPDPHAHPDYDNDRFTALGRYIEEVQPDAIICLGDFADMESLSSYDKGKKSFEGRRYKRDIRAAIDAQEELFSGITRINQQKAKLHKTRYRPLTLMAVGNHEGRIDKAVNDHPELEGTIGVEDLRFQDFWDYVVQFKETAVLNGTLISHYFVSGVKGAPIGGENPGKMLLRKNHMSSIQGHAHYYDMCNETRGDGRHMFGLVGGHYSHDDMVEGWNRDTKKFWRACVHLFTNLNEGSYDEYQFISQQSLLEKYL
jgi:hypothetical protein